MGQGGIRWVSGGDNDDGDYNRMHAFANGLPKHVRPNAAGSLSRTLQHFSQVGIILLLRERGGNGERTKKRSKEEEKKKEERERSIRIPVLVPSGRRGEPRRDDSWSCDHLGSRFLLQVLGCRHLTISAWFPKKEKKRRKKKG